MKTIMKTTKSQAKTTKTNKKSTKTTTGLMLDPLFLDIKHRRLPKWKQITDTAENKLRNGIDGVYDDLYDLYEEYDLLWYEEIDYIARKGQLSLSQVLLTGKNPADIYWAMPDDVKPLWNKDPELSGWSGQYR